VVYVHFESPDRPSLVLGPYRAVRFVGGKLYVLDGAEPIYLASQFGDGWHTQGIAGRPSATWQSVRCSADGEPDAAVGGK
jgi:hypothetical protein